VLLQLTTVFPFWRKGRASERCRPKTREGKARGPGAPWSRRQRKRDPFSSNQQRFSRSGGMGAPANAAGRRRARGKPVGLARRGPAVSGNVIRSPPTNNGFPVLAEWARQRTVPAEDARGESPWAWRAVVPPSAATRSVLLQPTT